MAKAKAIQTTKVKVVQDVVEGSPKKTSTPRKERTLRIPDDMIIIPKDVAIASVGLFRRTRKRNKDNPISVEGLMWHRANKTLNSISPCQSCFRNNCLKRKEEILPLHCNNYISENIFKTLTLEQKAHLVEEI